MRSFVTLLLVSLILVPTAMAKAPEADETPDVMSAATFAGLELREIGPALSSGRIADIGVDPTNSKRYFVGVASGGVWRTVNNGTTWTPVFDSEGSYSIGCVAVDPSNPNIVWVGTGENNSQRSVSFGDGIYRSADGGDSWKRVGLENSEHIGMIAIDPRDSDKVWVAAQGPLWKAGGDRGLYVTSDGGATWTKSLEISEHTGVNEVHLDPRDPDTIYATSYQRRRRVWTLIDGGPESGFYKTTDGGENWRKIDNGFPSVDLGRIGLDISPADSDVLYAIVEAAEDEGGFFRSTDRGESWVIRSDHVAGSPQYYNEIVADPSNVDRVYSLETWMRVSNDGGITFEKVPGKFRHVDDHALWIDPNDTSHLIVGCDGGVYESFDLAANWLYKANLPVAQFYRVGIDNSEPFYFVYGGTQDNATLGGPSRTTSMMGISNEDWFITVFGDGFQTRVDPEDPMIVYSEAQYGGLARHDRRSGEIVDIQPQAPPQTEPLRWNWDSPLIISPHSHTRLYFAAQRLFRSEDRGNSWQVISDDLSRRIDRNELEVMDRIWGPDAVAKNTSTSIYGNAVALSESPLVEGLLYIGTDDGLIHISEDGGQNWRRHKAFPGIPDMAYVSRLEASVNDKDTVFAAFDNHKNSDFSPYLLKSTDRGQSWTSITGDLGEKEIVWSIAEDHINADLLFAGTEFGLYFTIDGGTHWIELTGNMPTIAVRDIAIQRRESDLVLATYGRGFFILDDYSPLRLANAETLTSDGKLFPVKPALTYVERTRLGLNLIKGFQGDAFYTAPNPPFGAVFTYYLEDKILNKAEKRRQAEDEAEKAEKKIAYPTPDELRAEDEDEDPQVMLIVRDSSGAVVRRIDGPRSKGIHRISWDLRYQKSTPTDLNEGEPAPWSPPPAGPLALPGAYAVTLNTVIDGTLAQIGEAVEFEVKPLDQATFPAADREKVLAFRLKTAKLRSAVHGALEVTAEAENRIAHLKKAIVDTPTADETMLADLRSIEKDLNNALLHLRGDVSRRSRNEATLPSILDRVESIVYGQWHTTGAPTKTNLDAYEFAADAFALELPKLRLLEERLSTLETQLDKHGAPWTPGRFPAWEK